MMKLATISKSRGSISGQLLGGAQDVFMGSAGFSTAARKASTVAQKNKASTAAQKAPPVAQEAPTVAQKAPTVAHEAPPTVAHEAPTFAHEAPTVVQKAPTFAQKAPTFAQKAPTIAQKASTGGRIFASFMLYKGKAAFAAEPVAPTFTKNEAGDLFVKRSGYIMLSFSPSIGERKYDWERKQKFAMSATEVGSLISLGPGGTCDFFHDPGMQTSNAGQVRKSLQIRGNPDGKFYFISLSVVDNMKKINERFVIQVTPGEFSVLRTSFSFALPHIMGWDRYSNMPPPLKAGHSLNWGPKAFANSGQKAFASEWDR